MTWQVWQWTFELESAAHLGFHKVMHLYRTRPYVPARNLWAALTARVTQLDGSRDYAGIGTQIQDFMRFGYLYICEDDQVLVPRFGAAGWSYGTIPQPTFERRYLDVFASTAIDAASFTAEDESLHQVEILNPWRGDGERPRKTMLTGLVWARSQDDTQEGLGLKIDDARISIAAGSSTWALDEVANGLQVGGERRYGFGRLRLKGTITKLGIGLGPFDGRLVGGEGDSPQIELEAEKCIWAHAEVAGPSCEGDIEAVVGRDWDADKGAGRRLSRGALYWLPGSVLMDTATFNVDPMGFWRSL